MKLYKIRNWNALFENNRSRQVDKLTWVSIPNRHDGENFSNIVQHPEGAMIFSGFILMVEVASKCNPRGTLIKTDGTPHTPPSLSLKTRAPQKWFDSAIKFLETHTDWLDVEELTNMTSAERHTDVTQLTPACEEGKEGKEGKEEKGMEGMEQTTSAERHPTDAQLTPEAISVPENSEPKSYDQIMAKATFG
jgi:hypothetical protein